MSQRSYSGAEIVADYGSVVAEFLCALDCDNQVSGRRMTRLVVSQPPVKFFGMRHDVTALARNRTMNWQPGPFPALHGAYPAVKVFSNVLPTI